ncbi:MAG: hypothetical protein IT260_11685 [Saprospiraceae bacterium]|nr:hypothetical protein [Saprospiraceae bacterium]
MEKNRAYFKRLLAENLLDALYEDLFALLDGHPAAQTDPWMAEKHDELVLLSGKLNSVQQNLRIGAISPAESNIETSRINAALLELLNELPDSFFQQARPEAEARTTSIGIPTGLGSGLFWTGAVFLMMISLGSLILHNWITFAFLLTATLLCMPPAFQWIADRLQVHLSGSLRVLLIVVLCSVGLSLATNKYVPANQQQPSATQPR